MLVRKLRLEKGWSQETLAEVSGLSVRIVQRIKREAKANLETLGALARCSMWRSQPCSRRAI